MAVVVPVLPAETDRVAAVVPEVIERAGFCAREVRSGLTDVVGAVGAVGFLAERLPDVHVRDVVAREGG